MNRLLRIAFLLAVAVALAAILLTFPNTLTTTPAPDLRGIQK